MVIARLIRVLLVDDHAMVRQGLRSALQAYPNIQVVGEAADGEEAVLCAAQIQPAVVVMDINMSKMDGITGDAVNQDTASSNCRSRTLCRSERLPDIRDAKSRGF
jgi:DNA-binding NarL/FixJ family response regulator